MSNDDLQQQLRIAEARHERELAQIGEEHQKALLAALDEIQKLKTALAEQQEIQDYKEENARLVTFVQTVADSGRTKFAPDAKKLLGQ